MPIKINNLLKFIQISIILITLSNIALSQQIKESAIIEKNNNDETISKDSTLQIKEKLKSLMMDSEEEDNVNLAIESYKNGVNLLFTDEEFDNKEEVKKDEVEKTDEEENKNAFLHLASIIYNNSDEWTIWINDKKIMANNNNPENEIYVTNINFNKVDIIWKLSLSKWKILSRNKSENLIPEINEQNQVVLNFSLKSNQSFSLADNLVIEGRGYNKNLK